MQSAALQQRIARQEPAAEVSETPAIDGVCGGTWDCLQVLTVRQFRVWQWVSVEHHAA